ncbi:sulfotransferase family 2 domain-containing protein [Synechococcus sp. CBW1006]|uniref:sulfotransferase family 2 domain-containing protein n=1 Tax=Synechococcus sp. CBW1006 TaxID=1353138 RepID=UPI0018CF3727|nr:sulfotransferase family 2 domain-containing protein [Synechococcus sp. CBW1006]QPN65914.1 sulfotransferase family 2 domain-containing protein [Synechococcus sp. CBW1006]
MIYPEGKDIYPSQFRRDKFIFIHIPKCAGSSFLDSYLGYQLGHIPASAYAAMDPKLFQDSFSCAFIRNPIDRFRSAYNHIHTCSLWPYLPQKAQLIEKAASSLTELAESIHCYPEILAMDWFRPQHEFLMVRGRLGVSRVFKSEKYEEAVSWISDNIGISLHYARGEVNVRSKKGLIHNSQNISNDGIENLRNVYWKDFTLFGYF